MRWIKSDSISEANFDAKEFDEMLEFTRAFALFAAIEIAELCKGDPLAEQILEKTKTFSWYELPCGSLGYRKIIAPYAHFPFY